MFSNTLKRLFCHSPSLYRRIWWLSTYRLLAAYFLPGIWHYLLSVHLQFNGNKCKYMILSRKETCSTPHAILLNGLPLKRVSEYKYLGVYISSDLTLSLHINTICNNARKFVGMFHRRFISYLEYARQIWDPHLIKDIHGLKSVQKFALRVCTKQWAAP